MHVTMILSPLLSPVSPLIKSLWTLPTKYTIAMLFFPDCFLAVHTIDYYQHLSSVHTYLCSFYDVCVYFIHGWLID